MEKTVTDVFTNLARSDTQGEENVSVSNNAAIVRVNDSGQIVIPAAYVQALGVTAGAGVVVRHHNGQLHLTPHKQALRDAQALVRQHVPEGVSLVDELIADRRDAVE